MNSVEIVLKDQKLSSYNRLGQLILLAHFLYFTGYFIKVFANVNFIALGAGIGIAFLGLVLNITNAFKNNKPLIPFTIIFILLAAVWGMLENYWLLAALLVLTFFDLTVRKKNAVHFFKDSIELPSFPKRTIRWDLLNNVILKDRILTIDFKSNKLIQAEIAEESYSIDETVFNRFCNEQLQNKA